MSKVCEVCGKAPAVGRNVSHSHKVTARTFRPNIQKMTIKDENGVVRSANICTTCLKSGKVERA
ncbi:MAG: 50S ribosomal protein L28 [Eggerthellaceae bacterium]|nr:50S ribosomal protein L28 [Eggerthellaceae bacterium]